MTVTGSALDPEKVGSSFLMIPHSGLLLLELAPSSKSQFKESKSPHKRIGFGSWSSYRSNTTMWMLIYKYSIIFYTASLE